MTKQTVRFTNAGGSKLTVRMTAGKKTLNVSASLKHKGQPAATGCRHRFGLDQEAEAMKTFAALRSDAVTNGWTVLPEQHRPTFSAIPMANAPVPPKKTKAA